MQFVGKSIERKEKVYNHLSLRLRNPSKNDRFWNGPEGPVCGQSCPSIESYQCPARRIIKKRWFLRADKYPPAISLNVFQIKSAF